jgi:hypothetical protein
MAAATTAPAKPSTLNPGTITAVTQNASAYISQTTSQVGNMLRVYPVSVSSASPFIAERVRLLGPKEL